MVFSSHLFIFYFLPPVLLLYYLLPRRGRHLFLTVASYVFYGWSNPAFTLVMFSTTLVDYLAGLAMTGQLRWGTPEPDHPLGSGVPRTRAQRAALIVSIVSNLALLGFFKYFNFATENYNLLLSWIGFPGLRLDDVIRVTLPLGISFYTFQSMSYTIDVYRGHARALRSFIDFACFVSMFPQLVAGPIIRFSDVSDQLRQRTHTIAKFSRGAVFFAVGLAKKILLANPCGKIADTVFDSNAASVLDSWYGAIAYSFQIYFDFSGYSDMAIGLGLMLGFAFAKNFDSPYRSESITEFWRRWHMSLSSWLRDYLFLPLAYAILRRIDADRFMFMKTELFSYVAGTLITMFLGGLWHGAAWHFVLWGCIHGVWLAVERFFGRSGPFRRLPRPGRVAVTFGIVTLSWVFFRAANLDRALHYFACLFGAIDVPTGAALLGGLIHKPYYILSFAAAAAVTWLCPQTWDWTRRLTWLKILAALLLFWLSLTVMSSQAYNPFIYFIF